MVASYHHREVGFSHFCVHLNPSTSGARDLWASRTARVPARTASFYCSAWVSQLTNVLGLSPILGVSLVAPAYDARHPQFYGVGGVMSSWEVVSSPSLSSHHIPPHRTHPLMVPQHTSTVISYVPRSFQSRISMLPSIFQCASRGLQARCMMLGERGNVDSQVRHRIRQRWQASSRFH